MEVTKPRARLVLFYGPGSGMGKSTLARFAAEALRRSGADVRHLREEDAPSLPAFAAYVRSVRGGAGDDPDLLLEACSVFADECRASGQVWVADSLLPGVDWLRSAGCDRDEIKRFLETLVERLADLAPLLVFVKGDVMLALERALEERGEKWARDLAARRCGSNGPADLRAYFEDLQAVALDILDGWPFPALVLDTTASDRGACESAITEWLAS